LLCRAIATEIAEDNCWSDDHEMKRNGLNDLNDFNSRMLTTDGYSFQNGFDPARYAANPPRARVIHQKAVAREGFRTRMVGSAARTTQIAILVITQPGHGQIIPILASNPKPPTNASNIPIPCVIINSFRHGWFRSPFIAWRMRPPNDRKSISTPKRWINL
jgi:hypothetical protein